MELEGRRDIGTMIRVFYVTTSQLETKENNFRVMSRYTFRPCSDEGEIEVTNCSYLQSLAYLYHMYIYISQKSRLV
jgi:hypothetical protein